MSDINIRLVLLIAAFSSVFLFALPASLTLWLDFLEKLRDMREDSQRRKRSPK